MGMLLGTTMACAAGGQLVGSGGDPVSGSVMGGAGADLPLCGRCAVTALHSLRESPASARQCVSRRAAPGAGALECLHAGVRRA